MNRSPRQPGGLIVLEVKVRGPQIQLQTMREHDLFFSQLRPPVKLGT